MEPLERILQNYCSHVDSAKVTERKKCLDELKNLLRNQRCVELLHNNSDDGDRFPNWNTLFQAVHRSLLKECDRYLEEESKGKVTPACETAKVLCSSVIGTIARLANEVPENPRLICSDIISCSLEILENVGYRKHFGELYTNILVQYILPIEQYWFRITSENWSDLFDVFEKISKVAVTDKVKIFTLNALNLIIKNGTTASQLSLKVKLKFPYVLDVLKSLGVVRVPAIQSGLLDLSYTLCHQLGKESRFLICKFGEDIMSNIIRMYDPRSEDVYNKKEKLLELLLFLVGVHYPCGVTNKNSSCLAYKWDNWKRHLQSIYSLILTEVSAASRPRASSKEMTCLNKNVLILASCIAKQIFDESGSDYSIDTSLMADVQESFNSSFSAAKRRKLSVGFTAILDQLIEVTPSNSSDIWPMLNMVTAIILHHPELMQYRDYTMYLKFVSEKLVTCTVPLVTRHLCRCAVGLLEVRKQLEKDNEKLNSRGDVDQTEKRLWDAIWQTVLGAIGLNQCEEGVHELMQSLLEYDRVSKFGTSTSHLYNRLISLYKQKTVQFSNHSLLTLRYLSVVFSVPESPQFRTALMHWVLRSKLLNKVSLAKLSSEVVFACIIKSKLSPIDRRKYCDDQGDISLWEYTEEEKFYLTMSFETSPNYGGIDNDCVKDDADHVSTTVVGDKSSCQELMKILEEIVAEVKLMKNDVPQFYSHIAFFVYLTSLALKNKIFIKEGLLEMVCNLLSLIENDKNSFCALELPFLCSVLDIVKDVDDQQSHLGRLFSSKISTQNLYLLLESSKSTSHNTAADCFEDKDDLMDFTPCGNERKGENLSAMADGETQLLACIALLRIAKFSALKVRNASYVKLLKTCSKSVDFQSEIGFKIVSYILRELVADGNNLEILVVREMLFKFRDLSKKWFQNHNQVKTIIELLVDFVNIVQSCGVSECCDQLLTLVNAYAKFTNTNKYGPNVVSQFIRLIGRIIQVDKGCCWCVKLNDETGLTPFMLYLLDFLISPFNEVRMTAVEYIPDVFQTITTYTDRLNIQKSAYDKLFNLIEQIFIVDGDLSEDEIRDEGMNRSVCVLSSLIAIVSTSPQWRTKSLYTIFSLVVKKKLSKSLVHLALNRVVKNLKLDENLLFLEQYLEYIVWMWYQDFKHFREFPFVLLGCRSETIFYTKYKSLLVPVFLCHNDFTSFKVLCECIGESEFSLVQDCFGEVMACLLPRLSDPETKTEAHCMHNYLQNTIGEDSMKNLVQTNLDTMLLSLHKKLHDVAHLTELCGTFSTVQYPEGFLSHFSSKTISSVLRYLQKSSDNPNQPLLVFLCLEIPGHIQNLLHKLYLAVYEATTFELRLKSFHQYVSICDGIGCNIGDVGRMHAYVVRQVIHSLLHLCVTCDLGLPSLRYLQRFISICLPFCSNIVDNLLGYIVPVIVPMAKVLNDKGEAAVKVLELLILENWESLPSIAKLDPLPDDDVFLKMNERYSLLVEKFTDQNLLSSLHHFIQAGRYSSSSSQISSRADGLKHLNKQLSEKKSELLELYNELSEMRGFSEDCAKSVLHQFISSLIDLTSCKAPQIRESAARCLGELGPRDLTTLVLKPELNQETPSLASTVAKLLIPLMVDVNPNLAEASLKVLKSLFHTREGLSVADGLSDIERDYLTPVVSTSGKKIKDHYSVKFDSNSLNSALELICPQENYDSVSHETWLTNVVSAILEAFSTSNQFMNFLIPVCRIQCSVSEEILPYLVEIILESKSPCKTELLSKIRLFFKKHFLNFQSATNAQQETLSLNDGRVYMNKASVRVMLNVINFIRQQNINRKKQYSVDELNLDYLHIAQAAQYCSAYFTSILYSELWSNSVVSSISDDYAVDQSLSPLESICEHNTVEGLILQNLLLDAYLAIGEPDALYGCGIAQIASSSCRIKFYQHMGLWTRMIQECELDSKENNLDLMNSLRSFGLYKVSTKLNEAEYESAWRLRNWSLDISATGNIYNNYEEDYNHLLYSALRHCQYGDVATTCDIVNRARQVVINSLKDTSLEVANNIYQPLSRLQALREIEVFIGGQLEDLEKWGVSKSGDSRDECLGRMRWVDSEPILAQRGVLLQEYSTFCSDTKAERLKHLCSTVWLRLSALARTNASYLVARRCLQNVYKMEINDSVKHLAILEEAQLEWQSGDCHRARYLLRSLLGHLESGGNNGLYSCALLTYGKWLAEYKSENPKIVIQRYLEKAARACGSDKKQRLEVADCLGEYAHSEYQRLADYINSDEYNTKKRCTVASKQNYEQLEIELSHGGKKASADHHRALKIYKEQALIDEEEMNNTKKELNAYLQLAFREYLMCLVFGENDWNNLKVFRVVKLWLDNQEHKGLFQLLDQDLNKVPSFKFLPVLPQLVVRITDEFESQFMKKLKSVIVRCCEEHPHHSLWLLLALANSDKDEEFSNTNAGGRSKRSSFKAPLPSENNEHVEARVRAARVLVSELLSNQAIGKLVKEMSFVSNAYISLANQPIPKETRPGEYKMDDTQPIKKMRNMLSVACLTMQHPVNKEGDYSKIIGISKFEERYLLVGGVNQPKKIKCVCTDGVTRSQLVKGKDDLRQDAVMQQVFTILNTLLKNDENTARRKLIIRTYKVVALSQRSGVIEWCGDTEPLGSYLVGSKLEGIGAHQKYRPQDMSPLEARKKMMSAAGSLSSKKLEVFLEICSRLKPVFHHFFTERFPAPSVWFERRLSYIHSVATSSMIGYILGIGDRHVANILLDQKTAEFIHIDFGIAFEQGRVLPTPETVPFRLTRDIEDGMGVSGVEGVFRRCCEKTMEVLRKSQDPIVTAVEVLLYDPLYAWTITPEKASLIQSQGFNTDLSSDSPSGERDEYDKGSRSGEVNMLAERALRRLRQKLRGTEDGGRPTSIEGQVNYLIQQARDPSNLSRLFHGWQACL